MTAQLSSEEVARVAASLKGAHLHLALRISNRWIKGTGFCHRSVGRDLERKGLVESRIHRNERQIRAIPLGLAVRQHLIEQEKGG